MRSITAEAAGPVMVEVLLHGRNGIIRVEVDPEIERAELEVRTADASGPSAAAIADGVVAWSPDVRDEPVRTSTPSHELSELDREPNPWAGRLVVQVQTPDVDPRLGSRVEVVARVPLGSGVDVDTDHADVDVVLPGGVDSDGLQGAAEVNVVSQGGEVRVAKADKIYAEGPAYAWIGQSADVQIAMDEGKVDIGQVTDRLTVRARQADVTVGDAAGNYSLVDVQGGDITANVSGYGEHTFTTGNGLVTGTTSTAAKITAKDSRGPVELRNQRTATSEAGAEAAGGRGAASGAGAGAASGAAASGAAAGAAIAAAPAGPADVAVTVAVQAAATAAYRSGWIARHEGTGDRLEDALVGDGPSAFLHEMYTRGWDDRNKQTDSEVAAVLAASAGKAAEASQPAATKPAPRTTRSGGIARG
ncbi:hypothetical protein [Kribbella sp. NPDC055071]